VHFLIGTPDALSSSSSFDMVAMNMIYTHSTPYLGAIHQCLTKKGILVWSGILADEYQEAVDAALAAGFALLTQSVEGEWWCGTFER
jgi:ribosomal protein L11 methylase PrmA